MVVCREAVGAEGHACSLSPASAPSAARLWGLIWALRDCCPTRPWAMSRSSTGYWSWPTRKAPAGCRCARASAGRPRRHRIRRVSASQKTKTHTHTLTHIFPKAGPSYKIELIAHRLRFFGVFSHFQTLPDFFPHTPSSASIRQQQSDPVPA